MKPFVKKLALAVALLPALAASAFADSLTLTLQPATQYAQPGGSVTYVGTVTAGAGNAADIYLNGDSYTLNAPLTLDDSDFFSTFPLYLSAGQSFTGDLFSIAVPLDASIQNFFGSFQILGGSDPSSVSGLASANFTTQVTPEPSSVLLLATGVAGALAPLKRRAMR